VWPNDFQPMTTSEIIVGTLAGNNAEKIVGPFEWTPSINSNGYDSMLMIVSSDGDLSNADYFTSSKNIEDWRLVPNDNNIGQKNVRGAKKKPCFILTATYGSELETRAYYVHEFIDDVLLKSRFEKQFNYLLRLYFRFSPPIANLMNKNKPFKYLIKYSVAIPFLAIARTTSTLVKFFIKR